jgi:NAD(P)-dependent dehydrogenase (short-subunit alcohol dehydrogenase family)
VSLDSFRLDGEVCIVTGASSGIGAALARGLARAGAAVALLARRVDRIEALAAELNASGSRALAVPVDLNDSAALRRALDLLEAGLGRATVLINNAGIAEPQRFLKGDTASLMRVMATNFVGPWELTYEFARRLAAAKRGGAVVNVGSVLGLGAASGYASYSVSKAALHQLTRCLALEFVPLGIRVNAIAPGWFVTEMNQQFFASEAGQEYRKRLPPGRTGELEELLGPTLLLASRAGAYINGVVLPVDGGHSVALV